jgi:hypothetical protein
MYLYLKNVFKNVLIQYLCMIQHTNTMDTILEETVIDLHSAYTCKNNMVKCYVPRFYLWVCKKMRFYVYANNESSFEDNILEKSFFHSKLTCIFILLLKVKNFLIDK